MRTFIHSWRWGVLWLLLASLLGLAACNSGSEPETIIVYTALEDEQWSSYLEDFKAQYPHITVQIVRESTGPITQRLLSEKDAPRADAVWGLAATSLLVADAEGILAPYAPAGLDRVGQEFRDAANPPHWVGMDAWESAFCVNTTELTRLDLPMPESWADLTKPEYKDYLVMPNPNSSGTGFLSVAAFLQVMGEEAGWEYMDALHENMAVYTHSGSQPCKMAAAGEYPIGISFGYRASQEMQKNSAIVPVFPSEGSGWEMEANALIQKPDIKEGAQLFLDWAISDSVMRLYAANYPITSVKTDVPMPLGYPSDLLAQLIENDFAWAAENRQSIIDEWLRRYDSKSAPQE